MNQVPRTAAIEAKMLSNLSFVSVAISAKEIVRAQSRSSLAFSATHAAASARISSIKAPARAMPAIAPDTGARPSSPVTTITPTTKKAHEASARIIAPENVSTAATVDQ